MAGVRESGLDCFDKFFAILEERVDWRDLDDVEYATLAWVDWFNNRRLLESIGNLPPAEFEMMYYRQLDESATAA